MIEVLLIVLAIVLVLAVPVWMAFLAIVDFAIPWLFVGLILWAVFGAIRGPKRQRISRHYWPPVAERTGVSPVPTQPKIAAKPSVAGPELPIDLQVKVEQIRRKVDVLLGYASRFPPFSKDLYIVRQTASDYLPRTVDAYLALPSGNGDALAATTGKAAVEELREQLELLDWKLDEIAQDLQRRDLDRLLANRRFLEERFGRTGA
jgi:hypothetical protein